MTEMPRLGFALGQTDSSRQSSQSGQSASTALEVRTAFEVRTAHGGPSARWGHRAQEDVYVWLATAKSLSGKSISKTGTVTVVY